MNLEENFYIKNAIESFQILMKHKLKLLFMILLDVLFFFFIGFMGAPLVFKSLEQTANLVRQVISNIQSGRIVTIFGELKWITYELLMYLFLLAILYYGLYVLFQGYNWALAKKICNPKTDIKATIKKFAMMNLFWIIVFVIYKTIGLISGIRNILLKNVQYNDYTGIFLGILMLVSMYFLPITYVELSIKNGLAKGINKIHKILPIFLAVTIIYLAINFTINLIPIQKIAFTIGFLFYFTFLSWTRIYFNKTIEEVR